MTSEFIAQGWMHVQEIVVVEASPMQLYFSESMDHPHYTVHPLEYKSFEKQVKAGAMGAFRFSHFVVGGGWTTRMLRVGC